MLADLTARLRSISKRTLVLGSVGGLLVWVAFFDTHSLYQRWSWHSEAAHLEAQNAQLARDIESLHEQLQDATSDEVVEQIAREQYGMRREGETVYRVQD
ncbi:MAG: septum formation initiator family protein [Rhodothermales bacterium]